MSDRPRLLILWRTVPLHYDATSNRIFNFLKQGARKYFDVTLVCYDGGASTKQTDEIKQCCNGLILVNKPNGQVMLNTLKEAALSPHLLRKKILPMHYYSRKMQKVIDSLMIQNDYDLIYCDRPMVHYVADLKVPKILDLVDPVLYSRWQIFRSEKNLIKKGFSLAGYYQTKYFEVSKYKEFDACVTVSSFHKNLIESYGVKNVVAIPYGVDLEFFKPEGSATGNEQAIIFTGAMNYVHNVKAVDWFYNKVFPIIKKRFPESKLLIVGKNPSKEVLNLSSDSNVTVTGYVDDVRPYFRQAAVDIVPIVTDDGGFKTKILEAMAMGKPIVSTSVGALGIDAVDGKDIVIADGAWLFAERVCEFLSNPEKRIEIGSGGRKLVETAYSWSVMSKRLNNTLQKSVDKKLASQVRS
jgi:polysaccharide biosynthesis protein PslH